MPKPPVLCIIISLSQSTTLSKSQRRICPTIARVCPPREGGEQVEEVVCVDGVVRGGAGAGAILFLCHTGAWPLRSAPQPPHCAVVPPLVTTHHTVIHGAELLGGPTLSTLHTFHHNQVHIVPFPITSMADEKTPLNLSSKPPALHLQGPLAPCCLVCMARAVPTRSTGHHCPPQHNYSHLTVLLLRTFGASTDNIDTKESNMSRSVEFVHVAHTI